MSRDATWVANIYAKFEVEVWRNIELLWW